MYLLRASILAARLSMLDLDASQEARANGTTSIVEDAVMRRGADRSSADDCDGKRAEIS